MYPKISFCTTCKDRLHHLKKTLPINLKHDYPNFEIILLNYNSQDELDVWIRENCMEFIESGKLVYYKESTAKYFRMSHAKNVSSTVADGIIICNVDADNYITEGFGHAIMNIKEWTMMVVKHDDPLNRRWDFEGRIAIRKKDFIHLGGYDERMKYGWGYEDQDFFKRAKKLHFGFDYFDQKYVKAIKHGNEERYKNCEINSYEAHRKHEKISKIAIANHQFVANKGNLWGQAILEKNFDLKLTVRKTIVYH